MVEQHNKPTRDLSDSSLDDPDQVESDNLLGKYMVARANPKISVGEKYQATIPSLMTRPTEAEQPKAPVNQAQLHYALMLQEEEAFPGEWR